MDDDCELRKEEIEAIAEEDEICVVSNIARSGTPIIIPVSKCVHIIEMGTQQQT